MLPSSVQLRSGIITLFVLASLAHATSSHGQTISSIELKLETATVHDGQAGIPTTETFDFTFNRDLPFSSRFNLGFHWEPRRLNLREYSFFPGPTEEPKLRKVRFRIRHEPDTDYVLYVFGMLACSQYRDTGCNEPVTNKPSKEFYLQKRPSVINYTTAATMGTRGVSGTVRFGDVSQPPAKASRAAALRDLIEEAYSDVVREAAPILHSTAADEGIERTVVFLLDQYTLTASRWTPRAGAAPDAAGSFRMNYVRDGTYWPVAIHFSDRYGQTIGRYGYHDANGDFEPDPVTVTGGDVSGLNIVLMPDEPILARPAETIARNRARSAFSDAELLLVQALNPEADGKAALWRYMYFSPAKDSLVTVDVGSFNTRMYLEEASEEMHTLLPIAPSFVNSDQILVAAEAAGGAAFRADYGSEPVMLSLALGDLPLDFRPPAPSRFWYVLYESPPGSAPQRKLELFFDAVTGEQLPGQAVSVEGGDSVSGLALSLPQPHPVWGDAAVTFTLREPQSVRLSVFDVLGRRVAVLADGAEAAGTHTRTWDASRLAPGTYLLRLDAERASVQQAVVVVR